LGKGGGEGGGAAKFIATELGGGGLGVFSGGKGKVGGGGEGSEKNGGTSG